MHVESRYALPAARRSSETPKESIVNIFVSYSGEDRPIADALAVGLRQDGHEVFFDRDNLRAGDEYHARIRDDVRGCDLFIFLISPSSVRPDSYALTELSIARQRWPDPSRHVLPVLARSTPQADIPPYLTAVTYVQSAGNLIAETLANVAQIARDRRRSMAARIGGGAAIVAIGLIAAAWLWSLFQPADALSCHLTARITKPSGNSISQNELIVDVTYRDAPGSFPVSMDGVATIDVGPLAADGDRWTFAVRSAIGASASQIAVEGCPTTARTYALDNGLNVTFAPR